MQPILPGVEKRLQDRYQLLVREHTGHAHLTAAGPRCLPTPAQAKAHAQAAWRFFRNRRLGLPQLMQPLLDLARGEAQAACRDYALVIHDWSQLDYSTHTDKRDRIVLGHDAGRGYELYTALLVGDQQGQPVAPLRVRLRAQAGAYDSAHPRVRPPGVHLDSLTPVLRDLAGLGLPRPLVHIIDAEGDSVYHLRQWQAAGHTFLVRTDDQRVVRHEGVERPLPDVVKQLRRRGAFAYAREVSYQGRPAAQYVAEAAIVLERPAWLHRRVDGRRKRLVRPGAPLPLRLVVSEVRAKDGTVLARWQLLTNVPAGVAAATVALWYYWRWQVEACFAELTTPLRCEVETLGYPKAALFCFAVAALAANVFGAVRAALRGVQGAERVEAELSVPQVALDIAGTYQGMMIALPAPEWQFCTQLRLPAFAQWLRQLAGRVDWQHVKKTKRGPKKPPAKRPSASKQRHVSTARLLQQAQTG